MKSKVNARIRLLLLIGGAFVVVGLLPHAATYAQEVNQLGLENAAGNIGLAGGNLTLMIARIIRAFFGLLGIVAVGLIVWAGFVWMTAGGNEEKVGQAKKMIINATIGLAVILLSFAIASFIVSSLTDATNGGGNFGGDGNGGGAAGFGYVGGGELGQSIEYVLPAPGTTDVTRDTAVVVQFKQPLVLSSIFSTIENDKAPIIKGTLNTKNVKIYIKSLGVSSALTENDVTASASFTVETLADGTILKKPLLVIVPKNLLGNTNSDTEYGVALSGIQKNDPITGTGDLFRTKEGYTWNFSVGTKVDSIPPKITSVYPSKNSKNAYLNATVTVNFDKAILPTSILDDATGGMKVVKGGSEVTGVWTITNNAQSAEFRPNNPCGKSACGEQFYCLPEKSDITISATAASIDTQRGAPKGVLGTGVMSLSGNSLDGNGDGKAEGSPKDSVQFDFTTGSTIDAEGPTVTSHSPTIGQSFVNPTAGLSLTFSEPLLLSSVGSTKLIQPKNLEQWFYSASQDIDSNGNEAVNGAVITGTRVEIRHAPFLASTDQKVFSYMPQANEKLKDRQNNCFVPARSTTCNATAAKPYCCDGVAYSSEQVCANKFDSTK